MDGILGQPRVCPRAGCPGPVIRAVVAVSQPDYWIRPTGPGGRWWFTFTPPVPPLEGASAAVYRCEECGQTFRLVVAGPLEEPLTEA